jgi:hypothetical protein
MMTKRTAIAITVCGAVLLVAAGVSAVKSGPNPEAICTRAADKFILCLERTAPKAAEMSRAKRDEGIPACAADAMTVQMYVKCLEHEDCESFMKCTIAGAKGN